MMSENDLDRLLTKEDLAERWQVSGRTVMRRVEEGELRCIRIGRQIRFAHADVAAAEKRWCR